MPSLVENYVAKLILIGNGYIGKDGIVALSCPLPNPVKVGKSDIGFVILIQSLGGN